MYGAQSNPVPAPGVDPPTLILWSCSPTARQTGLVPGPAAAARRAALAFKYDCAATSASRPTRAPAASSGRTLPTTPRFLKIRTPGSPVRCPTPTPMANPIARWSHFSFRFLGSNHAAAICLPAAVFGTDGTFGVPILSVVFVMNGVCRDRETLPPPACWSESAIWLRNISPPIKCCPAPAR